MSNHKLKKSSNNPSNQFRLQNRKFTKKISYFSPWLGVLSFAWLVIYLAAFPNPEALAAKNWPLVFIGIFAAIIGNITAIGGGIVFIPVLMFAYQLDPVSALKLSFVTQAVGMTSGAIGWMQRGEVPYKLLWWTIPSLLIGAMISSFVIHPQALLVKGLFGPVSFLAGLVTLWTLNKTGYRSMLPTHAFAPIFFVSLLGGLITGWVAIGEGEVVAAFCMLAYGLKPSLAVGLGVVLLSINSIFLALIHGIYFGGVPWDLAAFTIIGVLWGGRLGPYLAQWIPLKTTKRIFAFIAMLDGLVIIFQVIYTMMKN